MEETSTVTAQSDTARSVLTAFATALNDRDASQLAELFTPEGDFVDFLGHWAQGRDAIRQAHVAAFSGLLASGAFAFTEIRERPLAAEITVCHGRWFIPAHQLPAGGTVPDRKGVLTFIVVTTPAGQAIQAGHNTEIRATTG